jgi:hypothetical protein
MTAPAQAFNFSSFPLLFERLISGALAARVPERSALHNPPRSTFRRLQRLDLFGLYMRVEKPNVVAKRPATAPPI